MEKKTIVKSTSFFVFAYIVLYVALTLLQAIPAITGLEIFNGNFEIPLDTWATGLLTITTAYVGVDRTANAIKTAHMKMGEKDIGSPRKVRCIIYVLTLIVVETYLLNLFYDVSLPMSKVATALISAMTFYVGGNKAISATASVDLTTETQNWANEEEKTFVDDPKDHKKKESEIEDSSDSSDENYSLTLEDFDSGEGFNEV